MIPVAFSYARPDSLDSALALLAEHGEDATVLAGGHSLLPVMKLRLGAPEVVIDIGRLQELRYIEVKGDEVAIGAGTRHRDLEASDVARSEVPLLASAAPWCCAARAGSARSPSPASTPGCSPR